MRAKSQVTDIELNFCFMCDKAIYVQVFHLECFQCSACEHRLQPGEQYAVSSGKLFCHKHFDSLPFDPPSTCTPLGTCIDSVCV